MKHWIVTFLFLISWGFAREPAVEIDLPQEEPPPIEKMPSVKRFTEAAYPPRALAEGREGTVRLEIVISDSGTVDSVKVLKGLDPDLDSAAVKALKQARFTPAIAGGQPVPVALEYEYTFALSSAVADIPEYVNFEGRVREKGTRTPVREAVVVVSLINPGADNNIKVPMDLYLKKIGGFEGQYLEEGRLVTTTDGEGRFQFKSLPACSIQVNIPATGYRPASFAELLEAGKHIEVEYRIFRESYDEYEIVVYGKAEKTEVARKTLSISEIKRAPGFGGDAIKVVRALPGVARPSFISGDIIIRGSGTEDTRFFLDGVNIPRIFHFGGLRSVYSSDLLSSIDMYPGGFGTRYGGAIGGIVEVKGRAAKSDRWHGKMDVNLLDAGGMLEGPLGKGLALQVAGRYSYIGKFIEEATKDAPTSIVPVYTDAYARLDWDINKSNQAFLTYSTSRDQLELYSQDIRGGSEELSGSTSSGQADDWFHMVLMGLNTQMAPNLKNELRSSVTRTKWTSGFFGFEELEVGSWELYLRDELAYSPSKNLTVKPGVDVSIQNFDYSLDIMGATGFRDNQDKQQFSTTGAYTYLEYKLYEKWLIMPGIRYDYYADVEEGHPSYRITSRLEYMPGKSIKGSAGTYSQSPKPWGQATDEAWGNPDLPATRARHLTLGHEWQISDLLSLDVESYYNTQQDVPNYTDSLNPVTGKAYNMLPDMDARMYGLELMLRHDQGGRFFGWVSYSLSRSERRADHPFHEQLASSAQTWDPDAWVLSGKDQTHNLQILGSWRWPRQWETGFRFRYVTGDPTTPLKSYSGNEFEFDSEQTGYVDVPGEPFSDRVDPFIQLDIRIDKKFVFNSWMLSTYLDFRNVNYFFYNSPEFYEYNYDKSKREAVGTIFLPSVGITAEF